MALVTKRIVPMLLMALALVVLPASSAGAALLYGQTDAPASEAWPSNEHLPGSGGADRKLADDFTVPPGQTWQVTEVDVSGGGSSNPPTMNVELYASSGNLPGAQLFSARGIAATNQPNYSIPLTGTPQLTPGSYWIAVQQAGVSNPDDNWAWRARTVQAGNLAVMSPGAFICGPAPGWFPIYDCFQSESRDLIFTLSGDVDQYSPPPPPSPPPFLSATSARSAVQAALTRALKSWRKGDRKRISCVRKSATRFRCAVSWLYQDDRFAGFVIARKVDGQVRTAIHVSRVGDARD